jgi:hypothetical protein
MKEISVIANGDLRLSANQACWPEQLKAEEHIFRVIDEEGYQPRRAHPYDEQKRHGFIDSQKHGREVFRAVDREAPLIVIFTAWQYSHHVLHGLVRHRGPILTLANWSGTNPGLVGMLNLNGSLTKAGVRYSTLWSRDFDDAFFLDGLRSWLETGAIEHDVSHVAAAASVGLDREQLNLGSELAEQFKHYPAIMGVFDEGCMGMFNAIVPDRLLHATGIFKERLSQSALYYESRQVSDPEAVACREWLNDRGMHFLTGSDEASELTNAQIHLQLKMYIAALRIADDFGCDLIGIQYQQGLKDLLPASDLAEGLINNTERPPVFSRDGTREWVAARAVPHFNEVDECAGIDTLVTHRVWDALNYPPETTLHDLRWGEEYDGKFVWVFEISGAAPPAHFIGGFHGASSERQPPMYFRLGGGTLKGISKPGEIVWSRVYVEDDRLKADIGRATVVDLPFEETERRWYETTPQWPIMHAVLHGITRDQMMARHKSNHIQVAYAPDARAANLALAVKVGMFEGMGMDVFVCGDIGIDG